VAEIAEAGSEPVVEVYATEYRLHCFQKEYAKHYKECMSGRSTCEGEELSCLVT
jgi:hypothetical protein